LLSNKAVIPDYLADKRSILLFDKTLIIFQIGASAREGDLFLFANCRSLPH
jgi:hypothetical protein